MRCVNLFTSHAVLRCLCITSLYLGIALTAMMRFQNRDTDEDVWETWLQGLPTRVAGSQASSPGHRITGPGIRLRLSKGATGVPLFTTWDSVAGPGRTPRPGNNSGRRQPGFTCCAGSGRPPGRRWILDGGLRVGGPGRPPCLRKLEESRDLTEGLGSVSLN